MLIMKTVKMEGWKGEEGKDGRGEGGKKDGRGEAWKGGRMEEGLSNRIGICYGMGPIPADNAMYV